MSSKADYANALKAQLPQAVTAIGADKLDNWANGSIASIQRDREFAIFNKEGLTQHLKNLVLCYLNLPSVGYSDFSDKKKVQGDQYRGYVARAAAVLDASIAELSILQTQNAPAHVISVQQSTIDAQVKNLNTWKKTLADALASGQVV